MSKETGWPDIAKKEEKRKEKSRMNESDNRSLASDSGEARTGRNQQGMRCVCTNVTRPVGVVVGKKKARHVQVAGWDV